MQQYSLLLFYILLLSYNYPLLSGIKINEKMFSQKLKLPQCIVNNKNKVKYCGHEVTNFVLNEQPELNKKKLITISPGGFKGFYMLGIVSYIKAYYDLPKEEYIFSGSSAGAWNALVMTYKGDGDYLFKMMYEIVREINKDFKKGSILTMQIKLRNMILNNFCEDDFALDNLFIGITHFRYFIPHTTIYTGFDSLSDAIDCCMASSHIPVLTGDIMNKYRGLNAFDGGFSKYPYLNLINPVLEIKPSIWNSALLPCIPPPKFYKNKYNPTPKCIEEFTTLFSKNIYDLVELFELGFLDTFENKHILDSIF